MEVTGTAVGPVGARILPHDIEAEQSVLGALMLDPNAVAVVRDLLEPPDFYVERHQHIFRAATLLADRGEPIDLLTLRAQLERDGVLSRSGGVDYVSELSSVTPTAASAIYYANIVRDKALRRRLVGAAGDVAALGFDETFGAQDAADRAEQRIFEVSDQRRSSEATHIAPVLKETWTQLETVLANKKLITGVPTNFSELDNVTQGLQAGELILLAARPSVGKTSFALNVARNAAVLAQRPVVIFSLEMTKESLVQRLLCSEAHVDSYLLKTGQADAAVFSRIAQAMDKLTQADLWIDDTPALSISNLRARARRMKAQYNIALVVVDYLQLMRGGRQESRVQEVSDISSGLKSIAKELTLPVLALSQLSRESERRTDRRPQLSDLRESGCLTGESRVWLASDNRHARIDSLIGREGVEVLALDETTWTLQPRRVLRAWATGRKPVFRLRTRLGRSIRASANHRFLTIDGWRRLDELQLGERIALPRFLPAVGRTTMSHAELGLLGHLIGDGCTLNVAYCGSALMKADLSRNRALRAATAVGSTSLEDMARGEVYWDRLDAIEPDGEEETYDLTVHELHNFLANDIVVHNSLEQDADIVLFLYRPGMHDKELDRSLTQLLVAKNRNGPVRDIELVFVAEQTAFREPYRGRPGP